MTCVSVCLLVSNVCFFCAATTPDHTTWHRQRRRHQAPSLCSPCRRRHTDNDGGHTWGKLFFNRIFVFFYYLFCTYQWGREEGDKRDRTQGTENNNRATGQQFLNFLNFFFLNIHFVLTNEDEKRETRETGCGRWKTTTAQQDNDRCWSRRCPPSTSSTSTAGK